MPVATAIARVRSALTGLRRWLEGCLLPPIRADDEPVWTPLAYLGFLFVPALVERFSWVNWSATLASVPVFLLLYFAAFWVRGAWRPWPAIGVALLAAALFPANPFSNTYTIYACVMAAMLPRAAFALVFALAQGVLFAIVRAAAPTALVPFIAGLTLLISLSAALWTHFYIARAREQHALRLSQDEVRRLAQVAERERIGRDLHDLLGHTLSVIALKAELATRLAAGNASAAQAEMAEVSRVAREALAEVRRAVAGMRALGLRAEFANARLALTAAAVEFDYRDDVPALDAGLETVLALALREAVTNVIRHADARRCSARLARDGAQLLLEITDDGRGGALSEGSGLTGMRERVEALGGSLGIASGPAGTTLRIRVPWRAPPAAEGLARPALRAVR